MGVASVEGLNSIQFLRPPFLFRPLPLGQASSAGVASTTMTNTKAARERDREGDRFASTRERWEASQPHGGGSAEGRAQGDRQEATKRQHKQEARPRVTGWSL